MKKNDEQLHCIASIRHTGLQKDGLFPSIYGWSIIAGWFGREKPYIKNLLSLTTSDHWADHSSDHIVSSFLFSRVFSLCVQGNLSVRCHNSCTQRSGIWLSLFWSPVFFIQLHTAVNFEEDKSCVDGFGVWRGCLCLRCAVWEASTSHIVRLKKKNRRTPPPIYTVPFPITLCTFLVNFFAIATFHCTVCNWIKKLETSLLLPFSALFYCSLSNALYLRRVSSMLQLVLDEESSILMHMLALSLHLSALVGWIRKLNCYHPTLLVLLFSIYLPKIWNYLEKL